MALCSLCNALKEVHENCPSCSRQLEDGGKVTDYLDPYGHYNDAETIKMGDGYAHTAKAQMCPHLLICKACGYEQVIRIQEE